MALSGNSFVTAGGSGALERLLAYLRSEGVEVEGNPDAYVREYGHFGAEEARLLRDKAQSKGLSGSRIFVVATPSMTKEAQNALLKVLEEPPAGARFFVIVPSPETLLPTLRSRVQPLTLDASDGDSTDAQKFLAAEPLARIELLKPLLEKGEDERRDMSAIFSFLTSLEAQMAKHPEGLQALYRARKYAGDRGALLKPLLEQLALLAPVIR